MLHVLNLYFYRYKVQLYWPNTFLVTDGGSLLALEAVMVHVRTPMKSMMYEEAPDHEAVVWMEKNPLDIIPVKRWKAAALERGILSKEEIDNYLHEVIDGMENI